MMQTLWEKLLAWTICLFGHTYSRLPVNGDTTHCVVCGHRWVARRFPPPPVALALIAVYLMAVAPASAQFARVVTSNPLTSGPGGTQKPCTYPTSPPLVYQTGWYICDEGTDLYIALPGAGGATTLLQLTDTPSSYSGQSARFVAVKVTEDGVEFTTTSDTTIADGLTLVALEALRRNAANDAWELYTPFDGQWSSIAGRPAGLDDGDDTIANGLTLSAGIAVRRNVGNSAWETFVPFDGLWASLAGKPSTFPPESHQHDAGDVNTGTFVDARIAQSNVTQHQGALSIGWAQLVGIPADLADGDDDTTIADGLTLTAGVAVRRNVGNTQWELFTPFDGDYGSLSGVPSTFAPSAHAASHSDGGADEIRVENLATVGLAGASPISDGAGGLAMQDVQTGAEQITHNGSGDHDGRYFTETELTGSECAADNYQYGRNTNGTPKCRPDQGAGGGLSNAYQDMTDGTNTATASGADTFKLRSSDGSVGVTVGDNDATHGDNVDLVARAATESVTGVAELAADGESAAGKVVQGNDARLSDARTPTAHAASHADGGADELTAENLGSSCTDVQVLGGDGTGGAECQADDDVPEGGDFGNATDLDGNGALVNGAADNAALADMANATIKCRNTTGTGDPEDCTAAQIRTLLNVVEGPHSADDQDATEVPYTPDTGSEWSDPDPTDVDQALENIAPRVTANDAKVSATGSVTTHSDVSNAGSGAIITAAERSKLSGIESGATADQNATEVPFTPTTPSQWTDPDPDDVGEGLDDLMTRMVAEEGKVDDDVPEAGDFANATDLDGNGALLNGAVDNPALADMAEDTIKCRNSSGTGDPEDCTIAQVQAKLNIDTEPLNGWLATGGQDIATTDVFPLQMPPWAGDITKLTCRAHNGTSFTVKICEGIDINDDTCTTDVLTAAVVCDSGGGSACASGCDTTLVTAAADFVAEAYYSVVVTAVSGTVNIADLYLTGARSSQ